MDGRICKQPHRNAFLTHAQSRYGSIGSHELLLAPEISLSPGLSSGTRYLQICESRHCLRRRLPDTRKLACFVARVSAVLFILRYINVLIIMIIIFIILIKSRSLTPWVIRVIVVRLAVR